MEYIRFGELPSVGKSGIWHGDEEIGIEEGVSVYPLFMVDRRKFIGIPLPVTKDTFGTLQNLIEYSDRKAYLVDGVLVGYGNDGEPLLKDAVLGEEIESRKKV